MSIGVHLAKQSLQLRTKTAISEMKDWSENILYLHILNYHHRYLHQQKYDRRDNNGFLFDLIS